MFFFKRISKIKLIPILYTPYFGFVDVQGIIFIPSRIEGEDVLDSRKGLFGPQTHYQEILVNKLFCKLCSKISSLHSESLEAR